MPPKGLGNYFCSRERHTAYDYFWINRKHPLNLFGKRTQTSGFTRPLVDVTVVEKDTQLSYRIKKIKTHISTSKT